MTSEPIVIASPTAGGPALKRVKALPLSLAWSLNAALFAALAYYHWRYEGWRETIIFASAVTSAIAAALTLFSRRPTFALGITASLCAMIAVAADVKRRFIEMVLHAYDIVFYLTSSATLHFLWNDHKTYLLAIVFSFAGTAAAGVFLYKRDPIRVSRALSGSVLIFASALAYWAAEAKGERRNTLFYWDNLYLSSFYSSWSETIETLLRGQLLDAAKSQGQPLFTIPAQCDTREKPPHIILIHQESVVPPSNFPGLEYDKSLDPFFKSFDGKLHPLRVETYGGASWLTEFSVLTGVSTYSFGGMRTFVQSLMQGKVHETLPQALARCGYRNTVFYPVPKDFVGNGRFYAAAGMPEIFDYVAQGSKRNNERDRFYYNNLLTTLEKHIADKKNPLFAFLITSATHLPYQYTYEPEVNVPGGGADPEMHEYLRRLYMAKIDYEEFRAALTARFPSERFLIVQYGDHQPVATRMLLGFDKRLTAEDVKMPPESPGFMTYYSVEGVNYAPPQLPAAETLDVAYLSTVLLASARLPLPPAYAERQRLLEVCNGRYFTCSPQANILSFHRRLIDSGLIDAR